MDQIEGSSQPEAQKIYYKEDYHNYTLHLIFLGWSPRNVRWAKHVTRTEKSINAYTLGKKPQGREDDIKTGFADWAHNGLVLGPAWRLPFVNNVASP
jgi:hypothetical protein